MASEGPPGKPRVALPNNRPSRRAKRKNQTQHVPGEVPTSPAARIPTQVPHRKSGSSATSSNVLGQPTTSSASTVSRPGAPTPTAHSNASPGTIPPKQAKQPCVSWAISGTCQLGSKCRYDHSANVPSRINRERQETVGRVDDARLAREAVAVEFAQKVQQAQEEAAAELARQAALQQAEAERVRARAHQAKQQAELHEWDRARRAAEVVQKARQAQEEAAAAAEAEAERARQAELQQVEAERVRARAQHAKEQAALLEWDRARRVAEVAQKAQEEAAAAAAEVAECARQEAVWQRAQDARNIRIEEARRAREAAEAAQKAQEDRARRTAQADARKAREAQQEEARQEEARRVRQAEQERERETVEAALKARQAQEKATRQARKVREARRARQAEQEREAAEAALKAQQAQEKAARQAEIRRAREAQQEEARRARQAEQEARMIELAKEEAAVTMQHIVLDFTVVTFSAGLAIQDVLLGFESCRIMIKNLPVDATVKEVCELFTQQGIEPGRFHVLGLAMTPAKKQEAFLIGHENLKMVAIALEESGFRQERLSFEIICHGGGDGMRASALDANTLTFTWWAPSVAYLVTFVDGGQAEAKVRELDKRTCLGRRVKAQMNQRSLGRQVLILGFPPEVMDQDVIKMAGSDQVERRKAVTFDTTQAAELIRRHIDSIPGVQITRFEQVTFDSAGGMYSARVHFGSWTQTRDVFNRCDQQRFPFIGNNTFFWLRLPDRIQYTIAISAPQYRAQKKSWDDLVATVQGKRGLKLWIVPRDRVHIVRIGGEDKKAVGSLKVRVESLAVGEKLEGWHPSLSQKFMDRVLRDTGALLRVDRRLRAVKVYGERGSIEAARALVNSELARLESQEQTVLLKRQSVRFFVTRGLSILKEELGDENATLIVSPFPAKIIIKGGDAARHTLSRLIDESLDASNIVPRTGDTEEAVCPICYVAVTSPMELGCGHAYCSACIRHFLTSASTFPLVCMGDEDTCHVPIPIPVVQRFLPIQQFTNILETAFITYIDHHPRDFKYCTTPDCRQVYRCTTSETVSIIHCPACLSSVCSTCHEEGHEGMTCSQRKLINDPEEQERLSDEFATQSGYKKCPQCTVWIEKTKGCNHMTCKCGAHICWVCMGIFDAASVNKHIRAVHGGIHEANRSRAEPPFQPDFAGQQETARLFALRRAPLAQQQRQQAEEDQRRLAQQLLDARQLREREDARRQEEARIAALAQQQRHDAEDARHRLAQQLLHERQKQEDARTEEVRTAARLRQAKQLLDARRLREQEDARIEEVRTAAQRQRLAAEDARHRLAVRLRDARQVQDREDARMQDEARKAELSRGVAERRRVEEAGLRRVEEADLRRAAAARRQDQEPEATEEGCVFQAWVAVILADSAWMRT
ncbi:hypothetical protein FIBSPDRAFT_928501 [Athelia psychrophila]|uniref:RBR-type E3 ubiquitin transferase n=1 Tax=Athelia psychrophila TaxID=1759441 RepID=A0A166Q7H9_9AGAM|nr:hypothetical protein FIBSPDRAFT_928501 [Fibularhizoctonia sp. CBS 109695]